MSLLSTDTQGHVPWVMLGVALLSQVTVSLVMQGAPVLAPFIQADFGLSRGQVGLCNSAFMGGAMVALTAAGWAVDIYGERRALIAGNVALGLLCGGIMMSANFGPLLLALFFAGLGSAFTTPAGTKAVLGWFPVGMRGMAMGIRQTGIPLGGALAAAILPVLAYRMNWRLAIGVGGAACLTAAAICWALYREPPTNAGDKLRNEKNRRSPNQIPLRPVILLGVGGGLMTIGQFVLITYLALYLKETRGILIAVSAMMLVSAQIAGVFGRILWGVWSDKYFGQCRRPPVVLAGVFSAVGAMAIGCAPQGLPIFGIAALVFFFAFNALGWHGNWVTFIAELAGPTHQGRALGLAMTMTYGGIILIPPLFGWLVDYTTDWSLAWMSLSGVLLTGVFLITRVEEKRPY